MKKNILLAMALTFAVVVPSANATRCTTIQDGGVIDSVGSPVAIGFDQWGYNYQGHLFNGGYCDAYRSASWCQSYADIDLIMKWNDAWLSNVDCDKDKLLDRHFGRPSYIDSGAWLTNHQSGKVDVGGKMKTWTYSVKIVAVTSDDYIQGADWYTPEGVKIGPVIWGEFAVVEEILNDPSVGAHGILYKTPTDPGLGNLAH